MLANKIINFAPVNRDYSNFLLKDLIKSTNKNIIYISPNLDTGVSLGGFMKFFEIERDLISLPLMNNADFTPLDYLNEGKKQIAMRFMGLANMGRGGCVVAVDPVSFIHKFPDKNTIKKYIFELKAGEKLDYAYLLHWLEICGFESSDMVYSLGEYVVKGGIIDIGFFDLGLNDVGLRIDLIANKIERIRLFDLDTQQTKGEINNIRLYPVSNVILSSGNIDIFAKKYPKDGQHYDKIKEGIRILSIDNLFEYFYDRLDGIIDYISDNEFVLVYDFGSRSVIESCIKKTQDYKSERYLTLREFEVLENRASNVVSFSPFVKENLF